MRIKTKKNSTLIILSILSILVTLSQAQDAEYVEFVGQFGEYWEYYGGIVIVDTIAYVCSGNTGLKILGVSDPASPNILSTFEIAGGASSIQREGDYLYVQTDFTGGFAIVDITDPVDPVVVNEVLDIYEFKVQNNMAYGYFYVGQEERFNHLQIIDLSDPEDAVFLGRVPVHDDVTDIFVDEKRCYVCTSSTFYIIDVHDPDNPEILTSTNNFDYKLNSVYVSDDIAFLVDWNDGQAEDEHPGGVLIVLDVSNIEEIEELSYYSGSFSKVQIVGQTAWVYGFHSLEFVDISDVRNPEEISTLEHVCDHVFITDDFTFFVGVGFWIYDMSDFQNPQYIGSYHRLFPTDIFVSEEIAYVGDLGFGGCLFTLDVSNPAEPELVGRCTSDGGGCVTVNDDIAYVEHYSGEYGDTISFRTIDVSDPQEPTSMGFIGGTRMKPEDIVIQGDYAYLVCGESLLICDISDPYNPVFTSEFEIQGICLRLSVSGEFAYISCLHNGLQIVNISNPENPYEVWYSDFGFVKDISVRDGIAYVLGSEFMIYNVSDPENPVFLSECDLVNRSKWDLEIFQDYAYIAADDYLIIIDISDINNPVQAGYYRDNDLDNIRRISVQEDMIYTTNDKYVNIFRNELTDHVADEKTSILKTFNIISFYPNPFNSSTTITFTVPNQSPVTLCVYNTRGQLVDVLLDNTMPAGKHSVVWDASRLCTGVYLIRMVGKDENPSNIQKIVLVK